MMQTKRDEIRANSALSLITRWFAMSRSARDTEPGIRNAQQLNPGYRQPDCGAYNEAFVMQHWASFGPRF
jgi:hypothetical protein